VVMRELEKVLKSLKGKQHLFKELYRIELEKEKHIQDLFPAFAIGDKKVISEIAEQKVFEKINEEIVKAIEKDLGDALG